MIRPPGFREVCNPNVVSGLLRDIPGHYYVLSGADDCFKLYVPGCIYCSSGKPRDEIAHRLRCRERPRRAAVAMFRALPAWMPRDVKRLVAKHVWGTRLNEAWVR